MNKFIEEGVRKYSDEQSRLNDGLDQYQDQIFDKMAERMTRDAGFIDAEINMSAKHISDLWW